MACARRAAARPESARCHGPVSGARSRPSWTSAGTTSGWVRPASRASTLDSSAGSLLAAQTSTAGPGRTSCPRSSTTQRFLGLNVDTSASARSPRARSRVSSLEHDLDAGVESPAPPLGLGMPLGNRAAAACDPLDELAGTRTFAVRPPPEVGTSTVCTYRCLPLSSPARRGTDRVLDTEAPVGVGRGRGGRDRPRPPLRGRASPTPAQRMLCRTHAGRMFTCEVATVVERDMARSTGVDRLERQLGTASSSCANRELRRTRRVGLRRSAEQP